MHDRRRLREVTPGCRGWRFAGIWQGRMIRSNVPYLVITTAVVTRHYTARGAIGRTRILRRYRVMADAVGWDDRERRWTPLDLRVFSPRRGQGAA